MDSILEQLPKLELEALVEVCDHFGIKYPGDKKGKRAIVATAFMSFVTKDDILESADQGEDMLRMIDGEISKRLKGNKTPGIKKESKGGGGTSSVGGDSAKPESEEADTESAVEDQRMSFLKNLKLREFKVNGVVGGSAGCIEYRDLSYQMTQGKTQGYSTREIRAGVIRAMKPGTSLRRYFEGALHLSDESFIQMLRSHYKVQDATTLFNTMIGAAQEPMELETDFVLRMLDLRNGIITLSKEEDCQFDETLVRKKFVHALSVGFAEDAVRLELRGVLKNHRIEDHDLLEEVSLVMQRECEHKKKLKHKYKEAKAAVAEVREGMNSPASNVSQDVLLGEIQSLAAQVGEIMKLVGSIEEYRKEVRELRKQVEAIQCSIGIGYSENYDSGGWDTGGFGNDFGGNDFGHTGNGGTLGSRRGGLNVSFSQGRGGNAGAMVHRGRGNGRGGYGGNRGGGRAALNNINRNQDGSGNNNGGNINFGTNGAMRGRGGSRGGRGGSQGVGRGSFNSNNRTWLVKCENCALNGLYCEHCTTCGKADHRRQDCPENPLNG